LWRFEDAIALGLAIGGVIVFAALFWFLHRRAPREQAPTSPTPSVPAATG
jgi:hypothetical protein